MDANRTINYYNKNAVKYYDSTIDVDMEELYSLFEARLVPGNHILDVGCGAGRDSMHFISRGFCVTAIEPSIELARLASQKIGIEVINKPIQDTRFNSEFDGIWACASLLHITYEEMPGILTILNKALKEGGTLFISMKKGNSEGYRSGRYYCDYTIDKFEHLDYTSKGFILDRYYESKDKRIGRENEMWLNVLLEKTTQHT